MKLVILLSILGVALGFIPQQGFNNNPYVKNTTPVPIIRSDSINNGDGSYQYNYESADGTAAQQSGYLKNRGTKNEIQAVRGSYSYYSPEGELVSVRYVADENGFQPEILMPTTPPPIPKAIQKYVNMLLANLEKQKNTPQQSRPDTQQQSGSDTQQQSRPDTQQQYRPDTQQQYRPDTQTQYRPDTQTQYRPDTQTQYRPDTQQQYRPDTQQQSRPDAHQQSRPDAHQQSRPDAHQQSRPDAQQSRPDAQQQYRPDTQQQYRPDTQQQYRPDTQQQYRPKNMKCIETQE